ncbi:MAG: EpsI family protein [Candidatus Omnitrophica bacterium]|nr:EpsI family protein [Candidatus Omnitrophota bacterium]
MNNKTFIIVIAILAIAAAIGLKSYQSPREDIALKIKVSNFPMQIGEWKAKDVPLSDRDYEILETRNLILRDYKNAQGQSIYLYLIYSEDNRKVSHPPEVCFIGTGATIVDQKAVQLTGLIKAKQLVIEKGNERQLMFYWYKAGSLYTDKYMKQQWKVVTDRTFGKRTSGALIRLSVDIKDNNQTAALKSLKDFAALIEPLLPKYVP